MNINIITNLVLQALSAVLNVIAEIKASSGLTSDQILAHAQSLNATNDQLYATLVAALKPPTPPTA